VQPTVRRFGSGILLGVFAVGCADMGPPSGVVGFVPPAVYASWWQLTERCSGRVGEFGGVRWYLVPGVASFNLEGQSVAGAWYSAGNRIVIAADYLTDGELIRHEMLHALLQQGGHPRGSFLGSCGDIVLCVEGCVRDAGGPPDTSTDAVMARPSDMNVTTLVEPSTVSLSRDSGLFTVTVNVTNTESRPVRVAVPANLPWVGFEFSGTGGGEGTSNSDTTVAFAPAGSAGSTRRYVFDVMPAIPDFIALAPGSYTVRSTFVHRAAPVIPLMVTH
jgi:hypothetical protein